MSVYVSEQVFEFRKLNSLRETTNLHRIPGFLGGIA